MSVGAGVGLHVGAGVGHPVGAGVGHPVGAGVGLSIFNNFSCGLMKICTKNYHTK